MKNADEYLPEAPDQRPLGEIAASRLASLARLDIKSVINQPVAKLVDRLKWHIDPELLLFRRVCGRVVKRHPVTGELIPVPFATVHVEDTDCSFLHYFPKGLPYTWLFPFRCRREEIATVKTDACGNFCVYVPRFEIDWILRFRRKLICRDIYFKPTIRDYVEIKWPPIPDPDPGPLKINPALIDQIRSQIGELASNRLLSATLRPNPFDQESLDDILDTPVAAQMLPPFPKKFSGRTEALRDTAATLARLAPAELANLDFQRFIGPFRLCRQILVAEWHPVFDVPDITFRVTQDTNGDGVEEVIYNEGYFDVRWNATFIPPVTLVASANALAINLCGYTPVPCGNTAVIQRVGLMPVQNSPAPAPPYLDTSTGYATRPNPPHPSGLYSDPLPSSPAQTPFARTLQLYGCNRIGGAVHYRVLSSYNGAGESPISGMQWLVRRTTGVTQLQTPDAEGWYPVLDPSNFENWSCELLLNWETYSFANGKYVLRVELGDTARTPLPVPPGPTLALQVDNSAPFCDIAEIRYKPRNSGVEVVLPRTCAVIHRPRVPGTSTPDDLDFRVTYTASAPHLRSAAVSASGCGAGDFVLTSATDTDEYWHPAISSNSVSESATYRLPGTAAPGAYSFTASAESRAFNPAGSDAGPGSDWNYETPYIVSYLHRAIAIVD
ncbi:MAG: hypothetical protein H7039_11710 [Bryobacteraceae bacterium]|nr:hypothetical protein [Bryobacteraceae bacterium]